MRDAVLLIDFGSTYTKVTAVDLQGRSLLATASAFTTVETDIGQGLDAAMALLEAQTGPLRIAERLACSSAAGGLRMITSGLVPGLTAEAARLASLGAGAKVVKVYSYQLTEEDAAEIDSLEPDIFLLTGGTDGGNTENILHNARMLAGCGAQFPILLAGNRSCAAECVRILEGRAVHRCPNVMPRLGELNVEPVQEAIRAVFLENIIKARGLSKARALVSGILMPTPAAVLRAMELLADGTKATSGLGDLVGVDLGGATTDVYSIARGLPERESTVLKGLPEPRSKRTVEGDIGMRYSAGGVAETVGTDRLVELSGLEPDTVTALLADIAAHPDTLPATPEQAALDFALAKAAVETAMVRHAGTVEQVYTPMGPTLVQSGKDLSRVRTLVLTGGALIHCARPGAIGQGALADPARPLSLRPKQADILLDSRYILAAMGLLAERDPDCALAIMKEALTPVD